MGTVVSMENITKVYEANGLTANDHVNFSLEEGEIHCLAGENGAGKTTLMNVLYGLEAPTSGRILLKGKEVRIHSPLQANKLGIGMVHQHFKLIPEYTVAQNVVLGMEPTKGYFHVDDKTALKQVGEVIDHHHFSIDPKKRVNELTIGQLQQVEIVKMLYRDVDILILDEPTAVLTEQEINTLFHTIRDLASKGKSLILITHKLHEIKAISHRVTILRKGAHVATKPIDALSEKEISRLMVGKQIDLLVDRERYEGETREVITFSDVTVARRNQERPLLNHLSFTAYSGEVLGFAAVGGNGLGELEAVLGGMLHVSSGTITYNGEDITRNSPAKLRDKGLAYVPSDRLKRGSSVRASVQENMIISDKDSFKKYGVMQWKDAEAHTKRLLTAYSVSGTPRMPMGTLSGGNIQKVILAREIKRHRDFMIFSEPTWGLDVASSRYVYDRIMELRDRGSAVILISSNLDEILSLADRIIVLYRGTIVAELSRTESCTKEEIGEYMLGLKVQESLLDAHPELYRDISAHMAGAKGGER